MNEEMYPAPPRQWPECPDCDSNEYVQLRDTIIFANASKYEWVCEDCHEPFRTIEKHERI